MAKSQLFRAVNENLTTKCKFGKISQYAMEKIYYEFLGKSGHK